MARRFEFHVPNDPPEMVVAERLEAIAADLERIADAREETSNGESELKRIQQQAEREHREELIQQALAANELRVQLPTIVTEAIAEVLEEADDLEHARELAGLDEEQR